jgi:hypothetical protein
MYSCSAGHLKRILAFNPVPLAVDCFRSFFYF